jgi:hypothetical protein
MYNNKMKSKNVLLIIILITLIGIVSITGFYIGHWGYHPATSHSTWAEFGDFYGGVMNPFLSLAAFIALLYTLHIQVSELNISSSELKLNREQFELNNDLIKTQIEQTKKLAEDQMLADANHKSIQLKTDTAFRTLDKLIERLDNLTNESIFQYEFSSGKQTIITIKWIVNFRGGNKWPFMDSWYPRFLATAETFKSMLNLYRNTFQSLDLPEVQTARDYYEKVFNDYEIIYNNLKEEAQKIGKDIPEV